MRWEVRALKRWAKIKKEIFGDEDVEAGDKYEIAFSDFEGAIPEFTWGSDTVEEAKDIAAKILSHFKRGVVEIVMAESAEFVDFIRWEEKDDKEMES